MAGKLTKWPKLYQYLPLQDPSKYTQNGTFGLKIYHLATLVSIAAIISSTFILVFVSNKIPVGPWHYGGTISKQYLQ
jgi:hypothetical protein